MLPKFISAAVLIAALIAPGAGLLAQPGPDQGVAVAVAPSFADVLFEEGDYFRAITEYRREIFLSDDSAGAARRWFMIGDAYLNARRYTEAFVTFRRIGDEFRGEDWAARADFRIGLTYLESGVHLLARKAFIALREDSKRVSVVGADRIAFADAMTYFQAREWDKCASRAEAFTTSYADSPLVGAARDLERLSREGRRLPRKSPVLAGLLSIIPGMGQIYEGRYSDGIQALLVTGVFGAATAATAYMDYRKNYTSYILPSVLGSITLVFYSANIYGAVNGARMKNQMREYEHVGEGNRYLPQLR